MEKSHYREHNLYGLKNFSLIEIIEFKINTIKVIESRLSERFGYDSEEIEIIKKIINMPQIQNTLSSIESLIGKDIQVKELIKLYGFENIGVGRYKDIHLSFHDFDSEKNEIRKSSLDLNGGEFGGCLSAYAIHQQLGRLKYKGKINVS